MNSISRANVLKVLAEPLGKRIEQKKIEQWAASFWRLSQARQPAPRDQIGCSPFVMMFPPPNITGNLHLGHALTGAIQDALVRHRRMSGNHCVFIPGFDHAGLATQNIVEKLLWKQKNISRQELGREKFTELANQWKDKKRTEMRDQLDRLGLDLSHDREYFTMDQNSSSAVQAAFKQLFNAGIIYRATKPIFWSEQLQTTLSDIEVDQVNGKNVYSRTGEIVEKRPLAQWFIDANEMAKKAVDAVQNNSIDMIPANYKNSWSSWLVKNGVQDWCISRQSWWGHRIPAYKLESADDSRDNWIVADSVDEAKKLLGPDVIQDPDVLDTWFSSSLLPLTVSGWPNSDQFIENCEKQYFPLHVMETGFDILTYWVSKMTMISLALTNKIPFKLVLLHGMICDSQGKKMSKSRGNVIDPLDVIDGASLEELQQRPREAHAQGMLDDANLEPILNNQKRLFPKGIPACGADGLRAYLLSHDVQEEIVRIQIQQIDKVRRLTNKIWNIFRFYHLLVDQDLSNGHQEPLAMDIKMIDKAKLDADDQQVLEHMSKCVYTAHQSFNDTYQLQHCFNRLELFIVSDLSQVYMSKAKAVLTVKDGLQETRTLKLEILATCLITTTKLLHPFMPHISEFLYQKLVMENSGSGRQTEHDYSNVQPLSCEKFPTCEDWKHFYREDEQ